MEYAIELGDYGELHMIAGRRFLSRLYKSVAGVAMTEFALAAPLLMTAGLWGVEVAWLSYTHLRMSQTALQIADNASRIGDTSTLTQRKIYESDILDLLIGANIAAGENAEFFERGRVIRHPPIPLRRPPACWHLRRWPVTIQTTSCRVSRPQRPTTARQSPPPAAAPAATAAAWPSPIPHAPELGLIASVPPARPSARPATARVASWFSVKARPSA